MCHCRIKGDDERGAGALGITPLSQTAHFNLLLPPTPPPAPPLPPPHPKRLVVNLPLTASFKRSSFFPPLAIISFPNAPMHNSHVVVNLWCVMVCHQAFCGLGMRVNNCCTASGCPPTLRHWVVERPLSPLTLQHDTHFSSSTGKCIKYTTECMLLPYICIHTCT